MERYVKSAKGPMSRFEIQHLISLYVRDNDYKVRKVYVKRYTRLRYGYLLHVFSDSVECSGRPGRYASERFSARLFFIFFSC